MKVWDGTWSGASRPPGLPRLPIIYEAQLVTHGQPDLKKIDYWAKQYSGLACLDIESWPLNYRSLNRMKLDESVAKYEAVLTTAKKSGHRFGFFCMPPNAHYAISNPTLAHSYAVVCSALSRILKMSDAIFLEGYYWWPDMDMWQQSMALALQYVKPYGKPVYTFLWDKGIVGMEVPIDERTIQTQLEWCDAHTDGVVWWSKSFQQFDKNAPWWKLIQHYAVPST